MEFLKFRFPPWAVPGYFGERGMTGPKNSSSIIKSALSPFLDYYIFDSWPLSIFLLRLPCAVCTYWIPLFIKSPCIVVSGWFSKLPYYEPLWCFWTPSLDGPPALSENDSSALVFTLVVDSIATGSGGGTTTKGLTPPVLPSVFNILYGFLVLVWCLGGLVVVGVSCNWFFLF